MYVEAQKHVGKPKRLETVCEQFDSIYIKS